MRRIIFSVHGMSGPDCMHSGERAVAKIPGVIVVKARLKSAEVLVRYDPSSTDVDTLSEMIRGIGYDVPVQMETSNG